MKSRGGQNKTCATTTLPRESFVYKGWSENQIDLDIEIYTKFGPWQRAHKKAPRGQSGMYGFAPVV
jgi:hypothetical protein